MVANKNNLQTTHCKRSWRRSRESTINYRTHGFDPGSFWCLCWRINTWKNSDKKNNRGNKFLTQMFFKNLFTCIHVPFSFVSHCSIYPHKILWLSPLSSTISLPFFSRLFSSFSSPFCYFFRHFLTPLFTFFFTSCIFFRRFGTVGHLRTRKVTFWLFPVCPPATDPSNP